MSAPRHGVFLDAKTIACELVQPASLASWDVHQLLPASEVAASIANAHVVYTNKIPLDAAALEQAAQLELIVVAATGYDIIDLEYCRQRGIAVANSPGYSVSSVPEHAIALMFAVARAIVPYHAAAGDGTWAAADIFCLQEHRIIELRGKQVGLVGSGSLGRATAELCSNLGMHTVFLTRHDGKEDDLPRMPLEELLATSDVISLHCPLTPDTRNMIDADALAQMKPGAILINTARGALVDADALVAALDKGQLRGAGIDVLAQEPPGPEQAVLLNCRHPGLVLSPHVAWASLEAQQRLARLLATTTDSFFAGQPQHLVS